MVAGFEPLDVLQSVAMLLEQFTSGQVAQGHAAVGNQYARVVRPEGNPGGARHDEPGLHGPRHEFEWRGLGWMPNSGLGISDDYADWDAERRWQVPGVRVADPPACECGAVLTGRIKPWQCRVFGTACTPATPIGTCMVSPEGACAAYYNFGRIDRQTSQSVVIVE